MKRYYFLLVWLVSCGYNKLEDPSSYGHTPVIVTHGTPIPPPIRPALPKVGITRAVDAGSSELRPIIPQDVPLVTPAVQD